MAQQPCLKNAVVPHPTEQSFQRARHLPKATATTTRNKPAGAEPKRPIVCDALQARFLGALV